MVASDRALYGHPKVGAYSEQERKDFPSWITQPPGQESVVVRCGGCGNTWRLPIWEGALNLDPVSTICLECAGRSDSRAGLRPTIPVTNPPPPSPYRRHDDKRIDGPIADAYARYDSDPRVNGPDDFEAFADAVETHTERVRTQSQPDGTQMLRDIREYMLSIAWNRENVVRIFDELAKKRGIDLEGDPC